MLTHNIMRLGEINSENYLFLNLRKERVLQREGLEK